MKIIVLGAAGFIGTNLALALSKEKENEITLVDKSVDYFSDVLRYKHPNIICVEANLDNADCYRKLLAEQDVVYHLISTTMPTNSNLLIPQELEANVVLSCHILEACVQEKVKKVIFISSGGTVYGNNNICPIPEEAPTFPISSYGLQKITIEKLLYLYYYMHGLDYRVIRLSNPYGPFQRPNGKLGAVTTFVYRAITGQDINIYGDGTVIRDFIFIDDAIKGILNIASDKGHYKTYNLGSGYGTSINQVLDAVQNVTNKKLRIQYSEGRTVDVKENYLDISRYEQDFGKLNPICLEEGIKRTADFLQQTDKHIGE